MTNQEVEEIKRNVQKLPSIKLTLASLPKTVEHLSAQAEFQNKTMKEIQKSILLMNAEVLMLNPIE